MNAFCTRCGAAREGDARYCVRCGASLESDVAPATGALPGVPEAAVENASRTIRLVNNLVDGTLVNVAVFLVVFLIMVPFAIVDPDFDAESPLVMGCAYLAAFGVLIGFYALFEIVWGRTPGKMLTSTRVVRTDGGAPSPGQILGRSAARLIPFESLVIFFNADRLTLHDRITGTRVVRVPR